MKHVVILANSSTICLDNIFTGGLPDLVVMGFVTDTAFAISYTENPYNLKNFKIKRMALFRNGIRVPRFNNSLTLQNKYIMPIIIRSRAAGFRPGRPLCKCYPRGVNGRLQSLLVYNYDRDDWQWYNRLLLTRPNVIGSPKV